MTGMGRDGANGCRAIRAAGGYVLGQDEASSDVYGMNKVAFVEGNVDQQFASERRGRRPSPARSGASAARQRPHKHDIPHGTQRDHGSTSKSLTSDAAHRRRSNR